MSSRNVALDKRRLDQDGHMFVDRSRISVAAVNEYLGSEIRQPGRALNATALYRIYRHPDALRRAAASFEGKPLLFGHELTTAENPAQHLIVGSVSDLRFEHPYLVARLSVWRRDAIDAIKSGTHKELSCGYRYDVDWTAGRTPEGAAYHGVMTNIFGNHVALVPAGRAGPACVVGDSAPTRFDAFQIFPGLSRIRIN